MVVNNSTIEDERLITVILLHFGIGYCVLCSFSAGCLLLMCCLQHWGWVFYLDFAVCRIRNGCFVVIVLFAALGMGVFIVKLSCLQHWGFVFNNNC